MYDKYGEQVQFLVVYIREAHPNDDHPQPIDFEQRASHAKEMCGALELSIPTVIDNLDNKVGNAYAGFPDRLYLIGKDGNIAYKGARGPFGFKPEELEAAIRKEIGRSGEESDARTNAGKTAG